MMKRPVIFSIFALIGLLALPIAPGSVQAAACSFSTASAVMYLDSDCETATTIGIPDDTTLDGQGYKITVPAGTDLKGGVVENLGDDASVRNLKIEAGNLANACDGGDDRLRAIFFNGASGSIRNNHIIALNQGASGCQEGNAIDVRNAPFDGTHPGTKSVLIEANLIENWQKTGIVANGDVNAVIRRNRIGASATQANLAANSIQVGFGAQAVGEKNWVAGNEWSVNDSAAATGVLVIDATATIQKNRVRGASDIGIYFSNSNGWLDKNRVSDNGMDAYYDYGIGIWDGSTATVTKNRVCGFDFAYSDDDDMDGNPWVAAGKNRTPKKLMDCEAADPEDGDELAPDASAVRPDPVS